MTVRAHELDAVPGEEVSGRMTDAGGMGETSEAHGGSALSFDRG